jgi:hypothetical protein
MKLIAVNDAGSFEAVNEPGDVSFFLSREDAEAEFEHWFSDHPHAVVDSDGVRYAFHANGNRAALAQKNEQGADPNLYRRFAEGTLRSYFSHKLNIDVQQQPRFEELSIENLNALVYALLMERKQPR